ncbi:hypothetical protein EDB85DRAFT_2025272 [Lactarius pseudohatsudake]|nr:hypothetical protein EDB85DRAFT_2025272 [Lactarius pseudohatsudake]
MSMSLPKPSPRQVFYHKLTSRRHGLAAGHQRRGVTAWRRCRGVTARHRCCGLAPLRIIAAALYVFIYYYFLCFVLTSFLLSLSSPVIHTTWGCHTIPLGCKSEVCICCASCWTSLILTSEFTQDKCYSNLHGPNWQRMGHSTTMSSVPSMLR